MFTSEEQIVELFSKVASVKRVIMGLDRNQKTPCGFCFVEYAYIHAACHVEANTVSADTIRMPMLWQP